MIFSGSELLEATPSKYYTWLVPIRIRLPLGSLAETTDTACSERSFQIQRNRTRLVERSNRMGNIWMTTCKGGSDSCIWHRNHVQYHRTQKRWPSVYQSMDANLMDTSLFTDGSLTTKEDELVHPALHSNACVTEGIAIGRILCWRKVKIQIFYTMTDWSYTYWTFGNPLRWIRWMEN